MKNRFNHITSKEWLPFQKSWFRQSTDEVLYEKNLRFFTKADELDERVLYFGPSYPLFERLAQRNGLRAGLLEGNQASAQFILIDLRGSIHAGTTLEAYLALREQVVRLIREQAPNLLERRFVSVFIPNVQAGTRYFAYAWDLAKHLSRILSLKDEKIACAAGGPGGGASGVFQPAGSVFYCLYFRKDERSPYAPGVGAFHYFSHNVQVERPSGFRNEMPAWFILKPRRRKKNEVLHPAKYPEELVTLFVEAFTQEGGNVFDPMAGTGSTQLGALQLQRNGYGTELSEFFHGIAHARCEEFLASVPPAEGGNRFGILLKDARAIGPADFPEIDYMLTSPPYWDMLNMKGAENQAKRIKDGLKTNYSDDREDLGNIADYHEFLDTLRAIYFNIASIMRPGSYMTIVVKNIKKKGSNYPFAWDLAHLLQEKLVLLPEVFWCQDDLSIAPYGYGNTWVSNTFHQYCLNFQVPEGFVE